MFRFGFLFSGGIEIVVFKSINNNIVSAFDESGREVVVIGKGIGYKAQTGSVIPPERISKVFVMSSQDNMERLKEMFGALPLACIELTDEILTYAKNRLGRQLNESAYFTLADHINFAITRRKQGREFHNVLLSEIRSFYSQEFEVGKYALSLMERRLGIVMPEDEAASIAIHVLNAEYDVSISDAFHAAKLLDKILDIVRQETGYTACDRGSYYLERFISHLKFLTRCVVKKEALPPGDDEFFEIISGKYPMEIKCGETIASYIEAEYGYRLPCEEICNLAIHIKRVCRQGTIHQ